MTSRRANGGDVNNPTAVDSRFATSYKRQQLMSIDDGDIVDQIYLSEDIMVEIFLRSPIKSLLRFRSICKTWQSVIDSPSFINQNMNFINTTAKNHRRHLLYNCKTVTSPTIAASLLSDDQVMDIEGATCCLENVEEGCFMTRIWGPLNGVYCVMVMSLLTTFNTLLLWNPCNRHSYVLPQVPCPRTTTTPTPINKEDDVSFIYGYGFDSLTNDYKIIGISTFGDWFRDTVQFTYFHVYCLSKNAWKVLDPFHITLHYPSLIEVCHDDGHGQRHVKFKPLLSTFGGHYLNGACHWLSWLDKFYTCHILSFDFGCEVFRVNRIPDSIVEDMKKGFYVSDDVTEVNGCLALVVEVREPVSSQSSICDVWVMKEYGVDESWIRAYRIPLTLPRVNIKFLGIVDDEFFVREEDGWVVSYRLGAPESKQEQYKYCCVEEISYTIFPYRQSLFRLNSLK